MITSAVTRFSEVECYKLPANAINISDYLSDSRWLNQSV